MELIIWVGKGLFGGFFVYMGVTHFLKTGMLAQYAASKNVPMPNIMVLLSGLAMVLGGLGIITGFFPRLIVLLLVAFLAPAAVKMHDFWTVKDPNDRMMQKLLFFRNVALIGAVLMLLQAIVEK